MSDVTGLPQVIPEQTVGACYGDALLAASAAGMVQAGTDWTAPARTVHPRRELAGLYNARYAICRELYTATRPLIEQL